MLNWGLFLLPQIETINSGKNYWFITLKAVSKINKNPSRMALNFELKSILALRIETFKNVFQETTYMSTLLRDLSIKKSPNFTKAALLTLAVAITGCNSNSTEAKQTQTTTSAPSTDSDDAVVKALESNLQASGIDQKVISAVPTSMENIYWVTAEGMPAFYSDKEGKHVIFGQIMDVSKEKPVEISSALSAQAAKEKLATVDKSEMIIYPAKGETKAVVYSFTDADCPYCTRMHSQMDQINAEGIEVRYLAWPRSQASVPKMEAIWCSDDRKSAMDRAKQGEEITSAKCDSPVQSHMNLGLSLGVNGTPAVFTESGVQIGGYLAPKQLAAAAIANK